MHDERTIFDWGETAVRPHRNAARPSTGCRESPVDSSGQECVDGLKFNLQSTGVKLWESRGCVADPTEGATRAEKDEVVMVTPDEKI